ncbi:hypothetical protein AAHA92_30088 [Salvia divinorum]|uniref:Pectinesterase inhibitor domain-containing protein n=1 Tax=Salvia divinorum TaxID=28513 RepID=A0ABD1G369_SALDI
MASYLHKTILFIALILAITTPISSDRSNDVVQQYLGDLCPETDDIVGIADCMISLAMQKAEALGDELNKWHKVSTGERSEEKYRTCSKSYVEVGRNLKMARRSLDSDDYRMILDEIDDAREELDECGNEFGPGLFEPGHVVDRNNELRFYLILARAATGRLSLL